MNQFRVKDQACHKHITEAVVSGAVLEALHDFVGLTKAHRWALAGGVAVGIYNRPRLTHDIDIVIPGEDAVQPICESASTKFKHVRLHTLRHRESGVEVRLLTAQWLGASQALFESAIDTAERQVAWKHDLRIVNWRHLAAMKLDRFSDMDQHDIKQLWHGHGPFTMPCEDTISLKAIANWVLIQGSLARPVVNEGVPFEPDLEDPA